LASSDALRRCALTTQERRQRGEQIEVLQVLVEQGALDRGLASSLWRELQAGGAAPRPAPSSDSGRLGTAAPQGQAGGWSPNAPTLRGDFSSPDATPTLGPGAIAQNMPGFPGAAPQGFGSGSFNAPPPGGFGLPAGGPPGTSGFGPPQGYGSGSFNAPPQPGFGPPQGYGSGSFNAPPQPGFGPPQGYGSGSFNAPGAPAQPGFPPQPGFPSQPGFSPQPGFGPPPGPAGLNGGPGFGPAPGYPGQLPPTGGGYDPTAMTVRSPVGGLAAPPVADTVRSPDGFGGDAEDLASTVKAPSGRAGPVDFQSDFDPLGSGFGNGPPPSQAGLAPQSQAGFPVDLAPAPATEPTPAAEPTAPAAAKKPRRAGASSRRNKAAGGERPVSGRVRAARAKREKKPSPAIYIGAGVALLVILIVVVAVVASSGPDPKASPSPEMTPVDVFPEDSPSGDDPRDDPPSRPKVTPSARPAGEGPIPTKYLQKGSSAEAPVKAEDLEGDLVARGDHMVEQAEYQEALDLAKAALDKWPSWLQGTPAHERFRSEELKRREKQLRFAQHLESLLKNPSSPQVAKMIGAIAGQHLHSDLEDLPCVDKFEGDMKEKLGEDEYDAIFVQEFDPKELQDDFKDDE